MPACTLPIPHSDDSSSTKHYVIIGAGVVSVADAEDGVGVVRATSVGVSASNTPGPRFSFGYNSVEALTVSKSINDVFVDVEHSPLGDISVGVTPAKNTTAE